MQHLNIAQATFASTSCIAHQFETVIYAMSNIGDLDSSLNRTIWTTTGRGRAAVRSFLLPLSDWRLSATEAGVHWAGPARPVNFFGHSALGNVFLEHLTLHLFGDVPPQTTRYGVRDSRLLDVLLGAYKAAFNQANLQRSSFEPIWWYSLAYFFE